MKILFLDDNKNRTETFLRNVAINSNEDRVYATKTAEGCISMLQSENWDMLFLDHDLGDEVFVDSNRKDCGMEVVRWLEKNKKEFCRIFVHTANDPARKRMIEKLTYSGYRVVDSNFLLIDWKNIYFNLKRIFSSEKEK